MLYVFYSPKMSLANKKIMFGTIRPIKPLILCSDKVQKPINLINYKLIIFKKVNLKDEEMVICK